MKIEQNKKNQDGYFVDYYEFGEITKDLLKNANVFRDKSPSSTSPKVGLSKNSLRQSETQLTPTMLPMLPRFSQIDDQTSVAHS